MNKRKITILGSTGSIGRQSIEVAALNSIEVEAISAKSSVDLIEKQARELNVKFAALSDPLAAKELKSRLSDTNVRVFEGSDGIIEMIKNTESELNINALVGRAGLPVTVATLEEKKTLALANKESLVCAGETVNKIAKENNAKILPVDSEHSAIWQCLSAGRRDDISRLILTASGGPFFGKKKEELSSVTRNEALAHPTWSMGAKITIDSATMMNKGFEIIEAVHLFNIPAERVDVLVHRESIVHSMVEFCDGAVISQMGVPDMKTCISLALSYPERYVTGEKRLDLTKKPLTFYEPDNITFPLMDLARECVSLGGSYPAVLNSADEAAVKLFLENRIGFIDISNIIDRAVHTYGKEGDFSLSEIGYISDKVESEILKKFG